MINKDFIKLKAPDGHEYILRTDIEYSEKLKIVEELLDKYDCRSSAKSWNTSGVRYFLDGLTKYLADKDNFKIDGDK